MHIEAGELSAFLAGCPRGTMGLVRGLRRLVRRYAPDAREAIRFHSICYYAANKRFGAIGGNICMIEDRRDGVRLSFLHGCRLADPARLLRGGGKSKRYVDIRSAADVRAPAVRALVRNAAALAARATDRRLASPERRRESRPR